jgi:hypothetical protein
MPGKIAGGIGRKLGLFLGFPLGRFQNANEMLYSQGILPEKFLRLSF